MNNNGFLGIIAAIIVIALIAGGALLLAGGDKKPDDDKPDEMPPEITPAPVEIITEEDIALLEVDKTECLSGENEVPKIGFTWSWSEIDEKFCSEKVLDETQFSICLLKEINKNIETISEEVTGFCGDKVCNEEPFTCPNDCRVESNFFNANEVTDFGGKTKNIFRIDTIGVGASTSIGEADFSFFEKTSSNAYETGEKIAVSSSERIQPPKELLVRVSSIQSSGLAAGFIVKLELVDITAEEEILDSQTLIAGETTSFDGKIKELIKIESVGVSATTGTIETQIAVYKIFDNILFVGGDAFFAEGNEKKDFWIKIGSVKAEGFSGVYEVELQLFQAPEVIGGSFIEFKANLMKLSFSDDFREDFHEYYMQKNFLDTPKYYTEEGGLGELFVDPEKIVLTAPEIEKPGTYLIRISRGKEPKDSIIVEFELIDSEGFGDNAFYYLNFNGPVGETSSGVDRQGYGLGYYLVNDPVYLSEEFSISESDSGTGKFELDLEKISNHFSLNLNPESRGIALKVKAEPTGDKRQLQVAHTIATPLLMHTKVSNASDVSELSFLYNVFTTFGQEYHSGNSLFLWQPIGKQCIDFTSSRNWIYDARNEGDPPSYMVHYDLSSIPKDERVSGEVYHKTVFYSTDLFSITGLGAVANNSLSKKDLEFKTPVAQGGIGDSLALSGTPGTKHNAPNSITSNFEQIFDLVREGLMCVQKKGDIMGLETTIKWNEPKLFDFIGTQLDVARQSCVMGEVKEVEIPIEVFYNEYTVPRWFDLGETKKDISIFDSEPPITCTEDGCYYEYEDGTCDRIDSGKLIVFDEFGEIIQEANLEKGDDLPCEYRLDVFFGEEFENKKFSATLNVVDVTGKEWIRTLGEFENLEDHSFPELSFRSRTVYTTWPLNLFFSGEDNFKFGSAEVEITTSTSTYDVPVTLEKKISDRKSYFSASFQPNDLEEKIDEIKFILSDEKGNISTRRAGFFFDLEILPENFSCEQLFGTIPKEDGINIILVTSKFSQEDIEKTQFGNYHGELFEKAPFDVKKEKFNFFLLDSTNAFEDYGSFHSIIKNECDIGFLDQDQVMLLLKENGRSHAGASRGTTFVPTPLADTRELTFVHEFGHSFGKLTDEYLGLSDGTYKRFSTPVFDSENPYGVNVDGAGCPRWCSGQLNQDSKAFQFYEGYQACIEPYKDMPRVEENDQPLLDCWLNWSGRNYEEEGENNVVKYTLDERLEKIDLGTACRKQTGCFYTAHGMGKFRFLANSIMNNQYEEGAVFGIISEEFMTDRIDNYNTPQIEEMVLGASWG